MAATVESIRAKIEKLQGTLARHQARKAKKEALLAKEQDEDARYWIQCDVEHAEEDIENTLRKISDAEVSLARAVAVQQAKEAKEAAREATMPAQLKAFRDEVVEDWTAYDIEQRDKDPRLCPDCYGWRTDEQLRESNLRDANALIDNFLFRVEKAVGKAADFSMLRVRHGNSMEGAAINGYVTGENGRAKVQTAAAGGWNIQRFHYRVLVHKLH